MLRDEEIQDRNVWRKISTADERMKHLLTIAGKYPNVTAEEIDISELKTIDGSDDWDAETPSGGKHKSCIADGD